MERVNSGKFIRCKRGQLAQTVLSICCKFHPYSTEFDESESQDKKHDLHKTGTEHEIQGRCLVRRLSLPSCSVVPSLTAFLCTKSDSVRACAPEAVGSIPWKTIDKWKAFDAWGFPLKCFVCLINLVAGHNSRWWRL
jgi:hypothetical protein